jgi:hypothetical protein
MDVATAPQEALTPVCAPHVLFKELLALHSTFSIAWPPQVLEPSLRALQVSLPIAWAPQSLVGSKSFFDVQSALPVTCAPQLLLSCFTNAPPPTNDNDMITSFCFELLIRQNGEVTNKTTAEHLCQSRKYD